MNPHSEEVAQLKRLIQDFPSDIHPEGAFEAFQLIAARYHGLEQSYKHLPISNEIRNSEGNVLSLALKQRANLTHEFLFNGILSNAGEFRKSSDPKDGRIGYGGLKHQKHRSKFTGTVPGNISDELDKAFAYLIYNPVDPCENAMRFYQHFVYIHPFYDANGRVGRVLVSTYLYLFDNYVRWGEFDGPNNGKFINKLNECHKRMKSRHRFEKYFGYLLDFFSDYVISIDELSDFK